MPVKKGLALHATNLPSSKLVKQKLKGEKNMQNVGSKIVFNKQSKKY